MINLKWLLQHDQTVRCTFLSYYLMTNILKEKLGFQLYFEILTSLTILESSNFPYVFFLNQFQNECYLWASYNPNMNKNWVFKRFKSAPLHPLL